MSRLDTSDPQIKKKLDTLVDPKSSNNWVVLGHVGNTNKIKVVAEGDDWDELIEEMNSGKIMYVLARFMIDGLYKYVFIAWVGDGIDGIAKGRSGGYIKEMEFFLKGRYHLQVNARNEDDMEKDDILRRLKVAKGANFDAQLSRQQREQKIMGIQQRKVTIEQSKVKEIKKTQVDIDKEASEKFWAKNQETKTEYVPKKDDYRKKEESVKFWEQQRKMEEEERKQKEQASKKPDFRSVTEQSRKFWAQQQQQEEEEAKKVEKPVIKADTQNLRARFEQMALEKQQQAVSRPPPPKPKPLARKFPPQPVQDNREEEEERRRQEEEERRRQEEEERRRQEEEERRRQEEEEELRRQEEERRRQLEEEERRRQEEEEERRRQLEEEERRRQEEEEERRRQLEEEERRRQEEEEERRRQEEAERLRSEELKKAKRNKAPPPPIPTQVDTRKKVIAMYDFDAAEEGELPFNEGEILIVLQEDENGWWAAENERGEQGLIPANYVEEYHG